MASKTTRQELTEREHSVFAYAQDHLDREGELEFDDYCAVSEGDDNGAYVQAWVWLPFDGTPLCKGDHGNHEDCDEGCPVFDRAVQQATE